MDYDWTCGNAIFNYLKNNCYSIKKKYNSIMTGTGSSAWK